MFFPYDIIDIIIAIFNTKKHKSKLFWGLPVSNWD